ncbi:DUF3592 domain-containing protein [Dictyobacter kobayashii]|uniref:DUF3592 domain-containing protein n=1 Tax=Dictyobacter kobayashii TaxID=2014872 RepID=A0A402AHG1_9CHLR|nr:DUF3592 domain-containing protein [Dictyobacter kobayashii]GCE18493.1 hypothetical protein KDK_22930 [Dictyobacter kobayashii]
MPKVRRQAREEVLIPEKRSFVGDLKLTFNEAFGKTPAPGCGLIIAIVILFMVIFGCWKIADSWILVTRGVSTTGYVYQYDEAIDCNIHTNDSYDVFFETRDNQEVDFERDANGSCSHTYAIGDKVPVLYNPGNPHDAEVATFRNLWLTPVGITILATFMCLCGLKRGSPFIKYLHQQKRRRRYE